MLIIFAKYPRSGKTWINIKVSTRSSSPAMWFSLVGGIEASQDYCEFRQWWANDRQSIRLYWSDKLLIVVLPSALGTLTKSIILWFRWQFTVIASIRYYSTDQVLVTTYKCKAFTNFYFFRITEDKCGYHWLRKSRKVCEHTFCIFLEASTCSWEFKFPAK